MITPRPARPRPPARTAALALAALLLLAGTGCGRGAGKPGAVAWEPLPAPLDRVEVHGLCYAAGEGALYAATNGRGVWCCRGGSPRLLTGPLDEVLVFALAARGDGSVLYAAAGSLGVWGYAEGEWADTGLPEAAYVLLLGEGGEVLYAGTNHAVWALEGAAWRRLEGPADLKVLSLANGPDGSIYAGTDRGVLQCSGDGAWSRVGSGPADAEVLSLAYDRAGGTLYAGTRESGVWGFKDGAWSLHEKGPRKNPAWSMAYDDGSGLLLVGTGYGAWTYNGGLWMNTGGETGEHTVLAVAVDPSCAFGYLGTFEDAGIWRGSLEGVLGSP